MENENDPFNSIILDDEEKSNRKPRFITCARCGKKIRNAPDKISGHERYCKRKEAEKASPKIENLAVKPVLEKEKITVKPAENKPVDEKPKKVNNNSLIGDLKGFKFNAADMIVIGGLVFMGLLFISVIKPARPGERTTVPAQTAEPIQQTAPIAPPYPYYR